MTKKKKFGSPNIQAWNIEKGYQNQYSKVTHSLQTTSQNRKNNSDGYVLSISLTPSPTLSNKKVDFKINCNLQTGQKLVNSVQKAADEAAT